MKVELSEVKPFVVGFAARVEFRRVTHRSL